MNTKKFLAIAAATLLTASHSNAGILSNDFFKDFRDMIDERNNITIYKNKQTQKFTIEIELPGYDKKDIKVKIDNKTGKLTIIAESKKEQREEEKNEKNVYIRKSESYEQRYFSRSFNLSSEADYSDPKQIETSYKNGVLKIKFPLKEKDKISEISLQINGDETDTENQK